MYHHMVCCAEQEVDCFGEYEMQSEHKPVTSSLAMRCRVQASLELYQNFFNSRERDIVFKKHMDLVRKALEESQQQDEGGDKSKDAENVQLQEKATRKSESQPEKDEPVKSTTDASECQPLKKDEKVEKADKYLLQLYKNMKLLEKTLEENPAFISCVHVMSHKKFEPEVVVSKEKRPVDEERMNELAKPTEKRLRSTLEGFRSLMPPEKQERLEQMLAERVVPQEKLEEAAENLKTALSENIGTRSELEKAAELLAKIEQKVTADMLHEMAHELKRKLPKLIKKYKEPVMVTSYWINLRDIALSLILSSHGPLRCQKELEVIDKVAGIVANFIIKIQLRSLRSKCCSSFPCSKPMRCVQSNEFLINLADKLIEKLESKQDVVENL